MRASPFRGGPRPYGAMFPAVLHAICGKPPTVFWFATLIGHAHSASKSHVNLEPGSAHDTIATTTPHFGQSTRGMSATSSTRQQPKSWRLQRRTTTESA